MHVENGFVTALNDTGRIIRFPLPNGTDTVSGRIDPLPDGPGSPTNKLSRDTEALAIFGGHAWVAYEGRNAVWRFRIGDWRSDAHARLQKKAFWPNNGGSEGIVRLHDGHFLVFSERGRRPDGTTEVLLTHGDAAVPKTPTVSLGYRAPQGYVATDAAELPDGRLLVLNRRVSLWNGVSAKLVMLGLEKSDQILDGEEIATLKPPLTVDNMEALSITREGGRTIIWMASDDNFTPPLQRTLLLKFALAE